MAISNHVSTRSKLAVAFALTTLCTLTVGALALRASARLVDANGQLGDRALPAQRALLDMQTAYLAVQFYTVRAILLAEHSDEFAVADALEYRNRALKAAEAAAEAYAAQPRSRFEQEQWSTVEASRKTFAEQNARVLELVDKRDVQGAVALLDEANLGARTGLFGPLERLVGSQADWVDAAVAVTKRTAASTRRALLVVMGVSAVFAVALGVLLTLSVTRPLAAVARETRRLHDSVVRGELETRGDAGLVADEFKPLVVSVNEIMDAFVAPIRLMAAHVDRIARGELPRPIEETWQGEFDRIKHDLNGCIVAVQALVADVLDLSRAAVEGELERRADPERHRGDFRSIVAGVNATLDALLGPVGEATAVLQDLAQRDLRARMRGDYRGAHARIAGALNATAAALEQALAQVTEAVAQVSNASTQIAASSQAVASGASEQACTLEETSSSLESLTATIARAVSRAGEASALADEAKRSAVDGGDAMAQMSAAMGRIKEAAESTSQIIKEVNEISFQTNLLALNAAVEAARAGEAGRGFAVVAEEVRSLAQRSKEAAGRTEQLIRQSVAQAQEGEATARKVSGVLSGIDASVGRVSALVGEIAGASKEQSAGIAQITKAVGELGSVTQQNAANAEESSSSAAELEGQAQKLAAVLGTFQLEGGEAAALPPAGVQPGAEA